MSLWDWSLAAWKRPGVEDAALSLQDVAGQNIPLLLWAAWAASQGKALGEEALEEACDVARAWEDAAIAPLRDLRRLLKKPVPDLDPAARETVRNEVRRA